MRQVAIVTEPALKTSSYGSVDAVLPLLEYLEKRGFDLERMLLRVGIPASALQDTKARFPKQKFQSLWQIASEATGDPAIALRVSTLVRANTLGIVGYLASTSESGRNAFELVRGLTPLLWEDVDCDLESDGEVVLIRCHTGPASPANRFTTEYAIGLTVTMSRALGAGRSDPLEARFSHSPPAYAQDYERILQLPVRFDAGENGVLFPISMMERSNPGADAHLRRLLERYAVEELARIPTSAQLAQRVRVCILSMLPRGGPTAGAVAAQLGMSLRTLRRRLQQESTRYRDILDDVREELARHYLAEEKRPIDEVTFIVGFSDPSAFTKAFRRWTGQTPADYARAHRG